MAMHPSIHPPSDKTATGTPARFRAQTRTHRGTVRENNEDALLGQDHLGFWAIADGVGGHDRGQDASAALMEELSRCLDGLTPSAPPSAVVHAIEDTVARLHRRLLHEGRRTGGTVIATTLALAVKTGPITLVMWAGDSRVYHQRGDRLSLITHDHVVPGGALSRAVGAGESCTLDTAVVMLRSRDRLLLCTDGLTKELSDQDLGDHLLAEPRLSRCADHLLAEALARGARDNVSLILVEAL